MPELTLWLLTFLAGALVGALGNRLAHKYAQSRDKAADDRRRLELLTAVLAELGENLELLRRRSGRSLQRSAWEAARGLDVPEEVKGQVGRAYEKLAILSATMTGAADLVDPNEYIAAVVPAQHVLSAYIEELRRGGKARPPP